MLPSRRFIVLPFAFRSMMHLSSFLWRLLRSVSRFVCVCMCIHLFQHCLLKKLSSLHHIVFVPSSKVSWLYLWDLVIFCSYIFLHKINVFFTELSRNCIDRSGFFSVCFLFWLSQQKSVLDPSSVLSPQECTKRNFPYFLAVLLLDL